MAMFGGGGLKALLDPGTALPVAAALMGGGGNQQNFANALGALGPAIKQNRTIAWLKENDPELAALVEQGGLDVTDAYKLASARKLEAQKAPSVETFYDDQGKEYKAQWTGSDWQRVGGMSAGKGSEDYASREAAAAKFGLSPDSPAYQSFVLTGKMPREDQSPLTATDKKAILEADDMVQQNTSAIDALTKAESLSSSANSGYGAGARAWLGNNLPDMMVPDAVSSPESSIATADMDNAVVGQALIQLKTIFGGNPTEGERKILLDLQGSSSMPKEVRARVFARAKELAVKRLEYNRQRAQELRGGDYYQPGGMGTPQAQSPGDGWTELPGGVRIRPIGQ